MSLPITSKARKLLRHFYQVPWCVPSWGWPEFRATLKCLLSGRIARGPHSEEFARVVARHLNVRYALPLNRGRAAIEVALRAMGLGPGDDVVLPSYLCQTVLDALIRVGVRPVFADVADDLQVSVTTIGQALTPNTRCVIVPHLFGNVAPIGEIVDYLEGSGISVIDDAAQSFGAKCSGRLVGSLGDIGIVSCGPGKPLAGAAGGLLLTNDRRLFERAAAVSLGSEHSARIVSRVMRFWFWRRFRKWTLPIEVVLNRVFGAERSVKEMWSVCAMSNLDAALALEQVRGSKLNAEARRRNARRIVDVLSQWSPFCISDFSDLSVMTKLVFVFPPGGPVVGDVIRRLGEAGIECQSGYGPCHQAFGAGACPLTVTDAIWRRVLCIPVETRFWSDPERLRRAAEFGE